MWFRKKPAPEDLAAKLREVLDDTELKNLIAELDREREKLLARVRFGQMMLDKHKYEACENCGESHNPARQNCYFCGWPDLQGLPAVSTTPTEPAVQIENPYQQLDPNMRITVHRMGDM